MEFAMPDATEHTYPTIDMTRVGRSMRKLHDHVCIHGKRVEITRAGCEDRCVMISKSELESLEQAVEIFADTEAFAEMSRNIQELLNTAGVVYQHGESDYSR
jgi:PHD/YefM family antitoxin component YafN of YafNO toxin-antitoxin module